MNFVKNGKRTIILFIYDYIVSITTKRLYTLNAFLNTSLKNIYMYYNNNDIIFLIFIKYMPLLWLTGYYFIVRNIKNL